MSQLQLVLANNGRLINIHSVLSAKTFATRREVSEALQECEEEDVGPGEATVSAGNVAGVLEGRLVFDGILLPALSSSYALVSLSVLSNVPHSVICINRCIILYQQLYHLV